ncbi:Triose-phosphate Transporter family [Musa troglodytarum]|uniref:Triose-phosphate Transporter family n=1 Tax=Musa troglodytarum TaxID=320322 RepID=A0A9E7HZX5_9LILI|nr:Triose-phosphate Transporter family [Musa troglodytarum]
MDVEGQNSNHQNQDATPLMSKGLRRVLIVLNCVLMALGNTGGPLLLRLYYRSGGKRQWLSSWLLTGGWPLIFLPLLITYLNRRRRCQLRPANRHPAKLFFITLRLFLACAFLGLLTGLDDFLYAYGLSFLPVSTSSLLISTQLAFTAFFAFLIVKQKFTPYSINSVALLTVGAAILGLHASSDRPDNVTKSEYYMGFILTLGAAVLFALILPLVELMYAKSKQAITYTLVMEMQLVMGFFATAFCTVGMLANKDFQAIPREARHSDGGESRYYVILVWNAVVWQSFSLGTVGIIFCVNTLLAAVLISVFIPVTEVLAVVFFKENFSSEKGVALALSLWGLASYSYGEYRQEKAKKDKAAPSQTSNHQNQDAAPLTSKGLRRVLIVLNCVLLALGNTGGPLLLRLYFRSGGKRQWLSSWLVTGGWPIIFLPLLITYLHRRRRQIRPGHIHPTKLFFITPRLFVACAFIGVFTGLDDFLYAYGLAFLPVSTSALLLSTHLAFTAFFAFLIVKQKFTPFSINSVALLTVGAAILGLHVSSDRPDNVTKSEYYMGFILTLGSAALYALILPLVQLMYAKSKQAITYTLVMEMQLVMGCFATAFCTVGMLAIPREARHSEGGESRYYVILVWSAVFWQFFFLGAVGVIFCVNTLLAAIVIAVFIPVTGVLGVVFFEEKFSSEKGVALVLALWGLASYCYGEYRQEKDKKDEATPSNQAIPREARHFELGEFRYYVVLVWNAVFWQFFFLGTVGVIFCVNTLLAGILVAVFIPVTEVLGVVFFKENFSSEKGVALGLSLWGLASYSYGEYRQEKDKKDKATPSDQETTRFRGGSTGQRQWKNRRNYDSIISTPKLMKPLYEVCYRIHTTLLYNAFKSREEHDGIGFCGRRSYHVLETRMGEVQIERKIILIIINKIYHMPEIDGSHTRPEDLHYSERARPRR